MQAGRKSARIWKKLLMTGGGRRKSSANSSQRSSALTYKHPLPTNNSIHTQLITKIFPQVSSDVVDANNNVISSIDFNTNTYSESGPLLKVVVSPQRGPVELLNSTDGATIVYTDASVKHGIAGIGVYFGENHPLNVSERLQGERSNNNRAEIMAATVALQRIRGWSEYNNGPIILRTDSMIIIEAMQKREINPRNKLYVELETLKKIALDFQQGVQFEHVYAHTGEPGNEAADELATKATSEYNMPSRRRTRSKPPSEKMKKRTRSAYIKRSAPAKFAGSYKKMKHNSSKSQNSFIRAEPIQSSSLPQPDIVALRDIKQMEMCVEKTQQSDRSPKENSIMANSTETKIPAVNDVLVETNEPKEVKITPLPSIPQSSIYLTSNPNEQRTPVNRSRRSRNKDGNPISWAPKKRRNPRLSQKTIADPSSEYIEQEKRRFANEKSYNVNRRRKSQRSQKSQRNTRRSQRSRRRR